MAKKKPKGTGKNSTNGNGANLGFEKQLWRAADKLRNNLDAAEYQHVVHHRPTGHTSPHFPCLFAQ